MNFRTVDAGRGVGWIGDGWNLVKGQLGAWILLVVVYFVIEIVLQIIPFVGGLVAALISPGLVAGMFLAARYADEGKTVDLNLLFQPFDRPGGWVERMNGHTVFLYQREVEGNVIAYLDKADYEWRSKCYWANFCG